MIGHEEYESLLETLSILGDAATMSALAEGRARPRRRRSHPARLNHPWPDRPVAHTKTPTASRR